MGQRAMIAMMLIAEPDPLIADEPTSALDVTVQNQVLRILDDLVTDRGMGLIFISHNLTVVSSFCAAVLVMYGGKIVEECKANALHAARHAYTRALIEAAPRSIIRRAELTVVSRRPSGSHDRGQGQCRSPSMAASGRSTRCAMYRSRSPTARPSVSSGESG